MPTHLNHVTYKSYIMKPQQIGFQTDHNMLILTELKPAARSWQGTWNFRKAVFREIDKSISK